MSQNITLWGASYSDVPAVNLPKTGGGTARFTDVADTTAAAADVASGKYFYDSRGTRTQGTGSGGGGSEIKVATATKTLSSASSQIQFTGLLGEPTSFVIVSAGNLSTGASPYKTAAVVFDGTDVIGQYITNTSNAQMTFSDSAFSMSYSNGTLTVTGSGTNFQANEYKLTYTYGGSASNIDTKQVQVGSGVTSITFTGLEDNPMYWSCIFTDDIGTSSGYTRAHIVVDDGSDIYGMEMGSGSTASEHWTATYSNGSLTISSQSTSSGGYFHQPGYYQLTYAYGGASMQTKTVTPTTSTQNVTADEGYDGLKKVVVNPIPSEYIIPTGNKSITENGNNIDVAEYATVSVSVSGGGTSKNTQVVQGTTRTTSSTLTAIGAEMTVTKTGTYDVYWSAFRSSTSSSYTYGTQLYVGGTAYGTQNTTWSNHVQNNHLTNVSLTANQKIRVYGRNSRGSSYYIYAPTLVIVEV